MKDMSPQTGTVGEVSGWTDEKTGCNSWTLRKKRKSYKHADSYKQT